MPPRRGSARLPDVQTRRSRTAVYKTLLDCLDVLRYQRDRWQLGPRGRYPENGPALHPHAWRALADDAETVIVWLTCLRDTAREEQHRLNTLNGD